MFRNLKKKFIIYNMTLLSIIFTAIFLTTAGLMVVSNQHQTDLILNQALSFPTRYDDSKRPDPFLMGAITLYYSESGELISYTAPPQISEEIILQASEIALQKEQDRGRFFYEEYTFAYAVNKNFSQTSSMQKLVMIDLSSMIHSLRSTLLILLGVSLLSLLVLFGVSVLFANRAVRPIKEAFERQKDFIADASHELKTPLAILDANLSVIESNSQESVKSQQKWFLSIKEQSHRMNSLVSDMLTLARMDARQQTEPIYPVNFSEILTGCLLSFEAVAFEKEKQIESHVTQELMVTGNREEFGRLIYILLDNAVKHTPEKGTVSISLHTEKGKVVLKVQNPGAIPEQALVHVFDRFYRADSARTREEGGFGLGLAIAHAIVEKHHGKIDVVSTSQTTTFTVLLPHAAIVG